jgi:isoleucyl-tRNA synthetase
MGSIRLHPRVRLRAATCWISDSFRVATLAHKVREEMDAYRLYKVVPELLVFIDDLTNWYNSAQPPRFWQSGLEEDKLQAYWTLYDVLGSFRADGAVYAFSGGRNMG